MIYQLVIHTYIVNQVKKQNLGLDNTHQLLSGKVDFAKKDFSVVNFEPIEVKQGTSNSPSTDPGKV
jgi:hypothetical protein